MRRLPVLLVLLLLLGPAVASADICDDIADLADAWDITADAVHAMGEEGYTRREAREAEELIDELLDATIELGDVMVDEGNRTEERMGHWLLRLCDLLEDSDDIDELVDRMDDVVDYLDEIVDYCDEQ